MSDEQAAYSHGLACIEAIASIGGDPATVAELVAVLRRLVSGRHFHVGPGYPCATCGHGLLHAAHFRSHESPRGDIETALAVLAKLPENSNEND